MAKTSRAMRRAGNPTVTASNIVYTGWAGFQELDSDLIRRANEASVTDIGDMTQRQYHRNLADIAEYSFLSSEEKKTADGFGKEKQSAGCCPFETLTARGWTRRAP